MCERVHFGIPSGPERPSGWRADLMGSAASNEGTTSYERVDRGEWFLRQGIDEPSDHAPKTDDRTGPSPRTHRASVVLVKRVENP